MTTHCWGESPNGIWSLEVHNGASVGLCLFTLLMIATRPITYIHTYIHTCIYCVASASVYVRAVPDLLLGNLAGAGFCQICKANPAGAGAGAGFHHKW